MRRHSPKEQSIIIIIITINIIIIIIIIILIIICISIISIIIIIIIPGAWICPTRALHAGGTPSLGGVDQIAHSYEICIP